MPRKIAATNAQYNFARDRLSTWTKFTGDVLCEGCFAYCCTFPVEVSVSDLRRLEVIDDNEMSGSPKKIALKLKKLGIIQNFRAATGVFILQQKADESCIFLGSDRKCTVYLKRPEVCRLFPKIGPKPGFCPRKT